MLKCHARETQGRISVIIFIVNCLFPPFMLEKEEARVDKSQFTIYSIGYVLGESKTRSVSRTIVVVKKM